MKSLTSKEMSYQDKFVIENFEVGSTPLMIEAATRILDVIKIEVDDFLNKKYLLVFGPGNNGGDLLVLSRLMYSLKLDFTLLEAMPWKDISLDNKEAKEIVINYDIPIYSFEDKIDEISNNTYDVIIDGILGTGFKGELESSVLELIECLNESKGYKLSVDIPSGISGTLGVGEEFFKSHCVVTFAYLKWAHLMRKDLGKIYLGDITFPRNLSINNHSVIE